MTPRNLFMYDDQLTVVTAIFQITERTTKTKLPLINQL